MTTDPHLQAVAAHIEHVVAEVGAGRLHQADALAVLAADLLGLSLREHVHPDTADVLLAMASDFASQRYAIVNAAAVAATLPDDASGLEDGQ